MVGRDGNYGYGNFWLYKIGDNEVTRNDDYENRVNISQRDARRNLDDERRGEDGGMGLLSARKKRKERK